MAYPVIGPPDTGFRVSDQDVDPREQRVGIFVLYRFHSVVKVLCKNGIRRVIVCTDRGSLLDRRERGRLFGRIDNKKSSGSYISRKDGSHGVLVPHRTVLPARAYAVCRRDQCGSRPRGHGSLGRQLAALA